ncbi:hypothetical protein F7018_14625 [Tenacibaculum aiptasiae]|uniref:DUF6908 domain-containing protein n=1 Tax=Tenacibaculum aiptasiae TaxID=426481 RepID=A0A7J5A9J2_9FLAO|nr:hypothetical protein [Tenacibaculum aiptasiae]KAB1154207.1 hypothetical protein F7018_14625 [Tenacibaculum aiptasiae]
MKIIKLTRFLIKEVGLLSVCLQCLKSVIYNFLVFQGNRIGNYSFAHYGKLNGDLMADPEMCFLLIQNKSDNVIFPYSYKNDYMGFNTVIYRLLTCGLEI